MKQQVSLAQRRQVFRQRLEALSAMVLVAYHRRMASERFPTQCIDSRVLSSDTSPEPRLGEPLLAA
jgi:hypothetical protein